MAESIVNGNASERQQAPQRALRVLGSSMLPKFQDGDIVVIDPDVQPVPGDFVVANVAQEFEIFRMFRPLPGRRHAGRAGAAFELVALDEGVLPLRSDVHSLRIVGTVVECRRSFAQRDGDADRRFDTDRQEASLRPWPSAPHPITRGSING
jgi:SOS-response transcriptional repressor LexA